MLLYIINLLDYVLEYNLYKQILTDCREGSYGYNCNESCGYCRNNSFCLQINGTCVTGCEAGFMGKVCKTRTYEG